MELIDIVNEKDKVVGVKNKDDVHRDGDLHRASRVYVVNSKGDILIHRRTKTKKLNPGYWDITVGGHVHSGETYENAAKRELKEELGIENVKFFEIGKWMGCPSAASPLERLMVKIFLVKFDGSMEGLIFDKNEISEIKFVKISELEKIYKNDRERGEFVHLGDFEETVKALKAFVK